MSEHSTTYPEVYLYVISTVTTPGVAEKLTDVHVQSLWFFQRNPLRPRRLLYVAAIQKSVHGCCGKGVLN